VKNPDGTGQLRDRGDADAGRRASRAICFLIHGTMDNNVPPYNTLLVADALIKANKEFDHALIPNSGHGYTPATTSCGAGGTTS
jgi:predicted esterase